jgi:glutamate-ammonia-ligase adenylyltransferase
MSGFALLSAMSGLPPAGDPARAARGLDQLAESGPDATALLADPRGRALAEALFGNSPFLGNAVMAEPAFFFGLLRDGPEAALAAAMAALRHDDGDLRRTLRIAKRRVALLVAVADIGGLWPLERITGALSDFAQKAVDTGLAALLAAAASRGELALPVPAEPCLGSGVTVIGMGKLGARELNYSSDIDIIVFYDGERVPCLGNAEPQRTMIRVVRELVALLQDRTVDGYVFRTDLRLRPDPGATAVALSLVAAEIYYESMGQNWERAAMIKARPVAGDPETGRAFMQLIAPFVWRRNLDFAAIEDIHSIKRQIHAHKGHGEVTVPGHDVKLGRGGIREIEFFAQTQQLIAGGRDRRLRESGTCAAIRALAATGRLDPAVVDDLVDAYGFLRRLEHRLQMVDDQQTQKLPADPDELRRIGAFMGLPDPADFAAAVTAVLRRVQGHYAALFETAPALGSGGALVFTGTDDDPETLKTLAGMGFTDTRMVSATIRQWHHGRYRAMRAARAREILTAIKPKLLEALAATGNPDHALLRFDEFLRHLPAGVQFLSLLSAQPQLLGLVTEILGTAPRLAAVLARRPHLFDALVGGDALAPLPDAAALTREMEDALHQARDYQDALDIARRFAGEREFRVGVQLLRRLIDVEGAARALTAIADAVLTGLLAATEDEFARQHGRIAGGGMAVVGMGKYGAGEMAFRSDLDLIFIYDHGDEIEASDGKVKLAPSTYFSRLSQRVINALTALTPEGRLYEVDMRLRPSGSAGPVAVRFAGFERYQRSEAWTWEHMALTRARAVAGPADLMARIETVRRAVLANPARDPAKLRLDVAEMHARVAETHGSRNPWNLKHAPGGLVDLEFIAQYLVLRHAGSRPEVLTGNTAAAYEALGEAGLLDRGRAAGLADATRLLRHLQMLLRLCLEPEESTDQLSPGLRSVLAAAGRAADFAALEALVIDTERHVAETYRATVETVAQA